MKSRVEAAMKIKKQYSASELAVLLGDKKDLDARTFPFIKSFGVALS